MTSLTSLHIDSFKQSCKGLLFLRSSLLCRMRPWKLSVGLHLIDWWYVVLFAFTAELKPRSQWGVSPVTLNTRLRLMVWWICSTILVVCLCFSVERSILIPDACISSFRSCEANEVPLSAKLCFGCIKVSFNTL